MAKPRVFISSTYYDLRNVRSDLERFIREQGYEPIMFERGNVAYGTEERLEEDCYREISTCDILINLIGGKFGSESSDSKYSISQNELKTAIKLGKQIYIFVEKSVYGELPTFVANRRVKGFIPTSVNDTRVFDFIEEILTLSGRNPVQPFEISQDIVSFLREQWAGLFQVLLQEHARQREVNLFERIESTAETLNQLVTFLTDERSKGDQAIKDILLSNHPLFLSLRKALAVPYPVFFKTLDEMEALLSARKTDAVEKKDWDSPDYREYLSKWFNKEKILRIFADLFDSEGKLRVITPDEWKDEYLSLEEVSKPVYDDDEIPF